MTAQSVGEIIKNGIVFDLKNWSSKMPPSDELASNVENLFQPTSTKPLSPTKL
ncbi:MAG: hypothetical protein AAF282_13815 [Cyanobacteria bacterium P01_A01_bin.15]